MNTDTPLIEADAAEPAAEPAAEAPPMPQWLRLQKLFRHTLKAGAVNPLLLIVPQYRREEKA